MQVISLQSGSNGNCIYVEAAGVRLLFDAGISGAAAQERLAQKGIDIRSINGLIISHDHQDHVRCAGVFQRKYGIPVYITPRTLAAANARCSLGRFSDVRHFRRGAAIKIDGVSIHTVPTPHDGEDGAVFIIEDGVHRLGIMTDLGHVFGGLGNLISMLDAVLIESNYDPVMLANGPYPRYLKERIKGQRGHISNREAAELLASHAGRQLQWICLGHLSEQNNTPEIALRTHREILGESFPICVASRYAASDSLTIK